MLEAVFVLEQTLGHAAHSRNLQRILQESSGSVHATVIEVAPKPLGRLAARTPGVRTWSFQAGLQTRSAVADRIRRGPVDALFIHTQVAAMLAGSLLDRVPTVVSLDATPINFDSQGAAYGHVRGGPIAEAIKLRWNRSVYARAAALVTWCGWAADSLVRDYGVPAQKVTVIHPGVDVGRFRPGERPSESRKPRVLFVGGDFERKGGFELIDAARVLGDGVEVDLVTSSDVHLPTDLPVRIHRGLAPQSPGLVELYRRADVFALPSRGDCFPQAVAEALASELPVVATDVGAIPEMVIDGYNGLLVPPRDPRHLAGALKSLIDSPGLRGEMGRRSRALAEREHDADSNNRRILDLMAGVRNHSSADLGGAAEMERAARAAL